MALRLDADFRGDHAGRANPPNVWVGGLVAGCQIARREPDPPPSRPWDTFAPLIICRYLVKAFPGKEFSKKSDFLSHLGAMLYWADMRQPGSAYAHSGCQKGLLRWPRH